MGFMDVYGLLLVGALVAFVNVALMRSAVNLMFEEACGAIAPKKEKLRFPKERRKNIG